MKLVWPQPVASLQKVPLSRLLPAAFMLLIVVTAIFADLIASSDPNRGDLSEFLSPPGRGHPMGTDALGRDVLDRVIYGGRVSLVVGIASVCLAMLIGVPLGIASAMVEGRLGEAIMRLTDIFLSMPSVLIALAIASTLGPSLGKVILLIGFIYWAPFARMVRAETLSLRQLDYIQATYAIGCHPVRIYLRHILPNLGNTLIVMASLQVAAAILLESTLSFLGVGVPPPTPTWGTMVAEGRPYVELAWWTVTFPGLAIMCTVLCINLLGDSLRDFLDPKLRLRS